MRKNSVSMGLGVCFLVIVMMMTFVSPIAALAESNTNNYPIVLINGFAGWGRDEVLGYKYWGGFEDLEQVMTKSGYKTYTATVSPFSSNWDRACELYAYIKGGTVDYGAAHSSKYGHARYGRTYPGLYPNWGITVNNKINKVHLVGHSMGGQTARTLVQLLEKGSQEEKNATTDN
jgi:triacylglycerol lipase